MDFKITKSAGETLRALPKETQSRVVKAVRDSLDTPDDPEITIDSLGGTDFRVINLPDDNLAVLYKDQNGQRVVVTIADIAPVGESSAAPLDLGSAAPTNVKIGQELLSKVRSIES